LTVGVLSAGATLIGQIVAIVNSTTVTLYAAASITASGLHVVINPWTVDGIHPTGVGHAAMAAAASLSDLTVLVQNPRRPDRRNDRRNSSEPRKIESSSVAVNPAACFREEHDLGGNGP
jgi:hypothetical protein